MSQVTATDSRLRSDAELLAAFAERKREDAFAEIVSRHGGMVFAVCRSVLGATPDAEDAAQAVFLTLAQKAGSGRVRTHLVGWLHRVAWYVAARAAQARATRRRHETEAAQMRDNEATVEDERLVELHAGLERMPEIYRAALLLHHIAGHSQQETAALLGCSVEAVAVRLHRGRELLKKKLQRRGSLASSLMVAGLWSKPALGVLPSAFAAKTATAATSVAAGAMQGVAVSGQAVALMQGAMRMLFWAKVRIVAVFLVPAILVGSLFGALALDQGGAAGPGQVVTMASSQPAGPRQSRTGIVTEIDGKSITIQSQNRVLLTVTHNAGTVITVDDKPGRAADIKVGMGAAVFFAADQPATEIRARTQ